MWKASAPWFAKTLTQRGNTRLVGQMPSGICISIARFSCSPHKCFGRFKYSANIIFDSRFSKGDPLVSPSFNRNGGLLIRVASTKSQPFPCRRRPRSGPRRRDLQRSPSVAAPSRLTAPPCPLLRQIQIHSPNGDPNLMPFHKKDTSSRPRKQP